MKFLKWVAIKELPVSLTTTLSIAAELFCSVKRRKQELENNCFRPL